MSNPWDRPPSPHITRGDATAEAVYLAVGKALSNWEALEAEINVLFGVVTTGLQDWFYRPAVRAIGILHATRSKAEMITHAARAFFLHFPIESETQQLEEELKAILSAYTNWTDRRNDIAHGCVTSSTQPDYSNDPNGSETITTYLLCPSHTATRKWGPITGEPIYQYRASEIDKCATGFEELAKRVRDFSDRLETWRNTASQSS
jgi:hypothetical protein